MRLHFDGQRLHLDLTDPELMLTEGQRAAMAFDREIVVVAGAGTGKTHTLSMRYVSLLLSLANAGERDVERVLVLTFTDKAAAEMSDRCHQKLGELCRSARSLLPEARPESLSAREGDTKLLSIIESLDTMADNFERARISTFHSFCARLLLEFPGATGTRPGTRPLSSGESARWVDRALDEALDEHLSVHPTDIDPLIDTFATRAGLIEAGKVALSRLGLLESLLTQHASARLSIERELAGLSPSPTDARRFTEEVGLPSLTLLLRLVAPSGGGGFVEERLKPALASLPPDSPTEPLRIYARYRAVLEILLNDQGSMRKLDHQSVMGTRDRWPDEGRYSAAREALRALQFKLASDPHAWESRAVAAAGLPTRADRAMFSALVPFSRWVLLAAAKLRTALDRKRSITFEEMQRRAVSLVASSPQIRARLRARFRYLMVDEFQDTDEPQWTLVKAIGREEPGTPEDRIFLVGDPKQAIYGFRGGDPTVFRRAMSEIPGEPLPLLDNFRSTPALIRWFNAIFPRILSPETPYEPLMPRRDGGTDPEGIVPTLIRCEERAEPAVMTARAIARLLQPGAPWLDRARYPSPPIALLLRARTRQPRYEAELRALQIPFVVVSGVGLWSRPEVLDVVNTLSAVAHGDVRSLIGYLRAPLGGLTDDEIGDYCAGRPATSARGEAMERFGRFSERARHVSAQRLLREIVTEMTPALSLADPDGRALQNVGRLLEIALSWGDLPLLELADRMVAEADAASREAEVNLVPSEARVIICTVHAAKGLEFPVVVVPELSARSRNRAGPLLVGRLLEGSLAIATRVLDPDARIQARTEPGRWVSLRRTKLAEEEAEERRLLYVAMTRARDRLLLVGSAQAQSERASLPTWMQLVERALPPGTEVLPGLPETAPLDQPPERPLPAPPRAPERPSGARRPLPRVVDVSAFDRLARCPALAVRADWLALPAPGDRDPEVLFEAALRPFLYGEAAPPQGSDLARHVAAVRASAPIRRALEGPGFDDLPFSLPCPADRPALTLSGRIHRLWLDRSRGGFVLLSFIVSEPRGRTPSEICATKSHSALAAAWCADQILAARNQPPIVACDLALTATGAVEHLPFTDEHRAEIPRLASRLAETGSRPWPEVEALAASLPAPPCETCAYHKRGCR